MEVKYITVFKDPKTFCSFPSAVVLPDGTIKVVFREAGELSVLAAQKDTPTHHDRASVCCIIESKDGANSFDLKSKQTILRSENGVSDPSISRLSDGTLLLRSIFVQVEKSDKRHLLVGDLLAHRPDLGTVSSIIGMTLQKSQDNGVTWTSPEIIDVQGDKQFCSRDAIVELEDGSWVLPAYKSNGFSAERAYLLKSFNQGLSWEKAILAEDANGFQSMFKGISYNEVSLLNLGSGKLLAMVRSDSSFKSSTDQYMAIGGTGELTQSWSDNAGLSWSALEQTGIFGQPAHLLKLADGSLLCTYGYRKQPYGIRACVSYDEGKTWDTKNEIVLKEGARFWDMGYPVSLQKSDGEIVSFYYWNDENKTRYIEAALWKIKS